MSTIATDVMVKVQIMRQPNGFQASIYDLSKHTKITLHAYNNTKKIDIIVSTIRKYSSL